MRRAKGKICAVSPILFVDFDIQYTILQTLPCPGLRLSNLCLLPLYKRDYLNGNQQPVNKVKYIPLHSQDGRVHLAKTTVSRAEGLLKKRVATSRCFTTFALGTFCIILHGPCCFGLCVERSAERQCKQRC